MLFLQVVVKPSGVMWHGSQGVTFHNKEDTDGISRTVMDLLSQLEAQDCVLVEDFHAPPTGKSTLATYRYFKKKKKIKNLHYYQNKLWATYF